jgi:hypothetical protein
MHAPILPDLQAAQDFFNLQTALTTRNKCFDFFYLLFSRDRRILSPMTKPTVRQHKMACPMHIQGLPQTRRRIYQDFPEQADYSF